MPVVLILEVKENKSIAKGKGKLEQGYKQYYHGC